MESTSHLYPTLPRSSAAPEGHLDPPLASLGLDRLTLGRLARARLQSIQAIRETPDDLLWRALGRHGLLALARRLEAEPLPVPALSPFLLWKLGRVEARPVAGAIRPGTPVADLWPWLGRALASSLRASGYATVRDLVPSGEAELRRLYRHGRRALGLVAAVLALTESSCPAEAATIHRAAALVAEAGRGARPQNVTCPVA